MCVNSFFDRSFMYAAPTLWNALDLDIRLLPFDAFKKSQDTSLFKVLCKLILMIYILFLFLRCVSTVIIVYIIIFPLNSYLYIDWILDFKSILLCIVVLVACVYAARLLGCETDGNAGVGSGGVVVAYMSEYMGGTRGSGVLLVQVTC